MKEPEIIASKRQTMDTSGSFPEGVTVVTLKWKPSKAEIDELLAHGYHEWERANGKCTPVYGTFEAMAKQDTDLTMSPVTAWKVIGVILLFVFMCLSLGWAFSLIAGKLGG